MDKKTLRRVQLTQLEIAKEFKRICTENNLIYMMEAGSMLGAIRHKGFIPWDDDMDFSMPREDYDKFFSIVSENDGSLYLPIRWDITPGYPHPFGKLTKKNTVYREEKMEKSYGIYIDIFPWDNMADGYMQKKLYKAVLMTLRAMIRAKCGCRTYRVNHKIVLHKLIKNFPFIVVSRFFKASSLIKFYDNLAQMYNTEATKDIVMQDDTPIGNWSTKAGIFDSLIEKQFEDTLFSVPQRYDSYLRERYGDYRKLPPENKRGNQHLIVELDFGINRKVR